MTRSCPRRRRWPRPGSRPRWRWSRRPESPTPRPPTTQVGRGTVGEGSRGVECGRGPLGYRRRRRIDGNRSEFCRRDRERRARAGNRVEAGRDHGRADRQCTRESPRAVGIGDRGHRGRCRCPCHLRGEVRSGTVGVTSRGQELLSSTLTEGLVGTTVIDVSGAGVTVRVAVGLVIPPRLAVMAVVPTARAEARPFALIRATAGDPDAQVTKEVSSSVVPSASVPVAVNCSVVPFMIEGFAGVTSIEDNATGGET